MEGAQPAYYRLSTMCTHVYVPTQREEASGAAIHCKGDGRLILGDPFFY